jgi:hypothetical protein
MSAIDVLYVKITNKECVLPAFFQDNFLHEHVNSFKNQIDHTKLFSKIYHKLGTHNMRESERQKDYLSQKPAHMNFKSCILFPSYHS